jgi:hypothetical protein
MMPLLFTMARTCASDKTESMAHMPSGCLSTSSNWRAPSAGLSSSSLRIAVNFRSVIFLPVCRRHTNTPALAMSAIKGIMTEKLALPSALVTACVPEFLRLSNADVTDGAPKLLNHFDASLAAPLMTLLTQPHAPPFDFAASDFALAGLACSLDFVCALDPMLAVVVLVGFVCALDPVLAVVVLVGFVCALDPVLAVVCSAGLAAHAGSTPVRVNSSAALILSVKYGGLSANVDIGCTDAGLSANVDIAGCTDTGLSVNVDIGSAGCTDVGLSANIGSAGLAAHAGSTPVRLNSSAALILSVKYGGLSANVDVGCTEPAPYHASGITNFLPVAA